MHIIQILRTSEGERMSKQMLKKKNVKDLMGRMFQKCHSFRHTEEKILCRLNSVFYHKEDKIFQRGFQ